MKHIPVDVSLMYLLYLAWLHNGTWYASPFITYRTINPVFARYRIPHVTDKALRSIIRRTPVSGRVLSVLFSLLLFPFVFLFGFVHFSSSLFSFLTEVEPPCLETTSGPLPSLICVSSFSSPPLGAATVL